MVRRLAASNGDAAFVVSDDLVADPQSQSGSGCSLGGIEGFEERTLGAWGHTAAGVSDDEPDPRSSGAQIFGFADANEETASCGHGVERVRHEVDEHLAELTLIAVKRIDMSEVFLED